MMSTLRRMAIAIAALAALTLAAPAWAQQGGEAAPEGTPSGARDPAYAAALKRANDFYNGGDYEAAIQSYVQVIQLAPDAPDAYRNLARAYFWSGAYGASLAYYDVYLVTFPDAGDVEQVRRERRLTSERASTPWKLPEEQRVAMRALEDRLDQGPFYTRGGGGAWKSYQSLLRTGYAQPGLIKLRERLLRKLVEEFDARLTTKPGEPAPSLQLEDWELQKDRLEAASKLALDAEQRAIITRREPIVEAALALLLSRFEAAAARAEIASQRNPELIFLRWFRVTALMRANRPRQALGVLDELAPILSQRDSAQLDYHRVVRAMILQRLGEHDEAASIYIGVFQRQ